jgi:hypothetical protein
MHKLAPVQYLNESGFSFSVPVYSQGVYFGVRDLRLAPIVPVMPDAIPEPVAQPSVQFFEFAVNTCHTEVVHPSPLNFVEFLNTFIKAHWSGFAGNDFKLLLKLFPTLFGYNQLILAFLTFFVGRYESETQTGIMYRFSNSAFLPVNR